MPGARRSVGLAKRHTVLVGVPNNAPAMVVYTGVGGLVGNPLDTGNGSPTGITDAKLVEWVTQRAIGGLTFAWQLEPATKTLQTQSYNPTTGALPTGDTPSTRNAWWQESNKLKWGATANTRTWWQRCVELGIKNYALAGLTPSTDNTHVLGTTWENDTTWGATTILGALTPTTGSRLADLIAWAKAVQHTNDSIAGFTGIWFDLEASDSTPWRHPYPGMPGGQTEATTRAKIKLRAAQIEKIIATHAPSVVDILVYFDRGTDSWNELEYDDSINGSQGLHPFADRCYDSFTAGLAGGTTRYTQTDEVFYRGVGLGTENPTGYKNAQIYNLNGRNARQTNALVTQSDAERLTVMRNTNRAMFIWPAEGGGPGGEGWSMTFATNTVPGLIQQSVLWSQRFHAVYVQGHFANQTFDDGSTFPNRNYNLYEAAWQQYLVSGVAQATSPTGAITTINGSTFSGSTFATTGTTVTIGGTATDDFALARIEWANAANATAGAPTMTLTLDSAWDVHNSAVLPKNTSLGPAAWHMNWTTGSIPLAAGVNNITVTVVNIHGLTTVIPLTVTSAPYTFDFTGTNGAAVAGWTVFGNTVDVQSNKMRIQTPASAGSVAGAYLTSTLPFQDYELTANATLAIVSATDFYGAVNVRAGSTSFNGIREYSSWHVRFFGQTGAGFVQLYRIDGAGVETFLTSTQVTTFTQSSVLRIRIRLVGQNIKVRAWRDAESEPGTWAIDYTDTSAPTGNRVSTAVGNGAAVAADRWDWDDVVITQIAATAPLADFTVSANPAPNVATTFTDISTNTPTQWEWNFGDLTPTSAVQNPSHTYTAIGTYNVQLTAANAGGSNAISKSVGVTAGSSNPSGQAPPSGNIAGWNLAFVEDFNTNTAVGSWGPTGPGGAPAPYNTNFGVYDEGWEDTANSIGESTNSYYSPLTVLSTSNSCLQWHLYNSGSGARSAAVRVGGDRQSGRVAMRFRAEAVDGFKTAWLWWPADDDWPRNGEIDFPEGSLQGGTISGFMHRQDATSGSDQDFGDSGQSYLAWHTAVVEWTSGVRCKFILDGSTVLDVTSRVPNTPMHFVLQTESDLGSNQPPNGTSGLMFLDWIAYYTPA